MTRNAIAYFGSRERFSLAAQELSSDNLEVIYLDLRHLQTLANECHAIRLLWVEFGAIINASILDYFPSLEWVVTSTTGLSHIDTKECKQRGITVISLLDFKDITQNITSTAELTWLLVLGVWRRITLNLINSNQEIVDIPSRREENRGLQLSDRQIGIIGFGRVGKQIAKYASAFGMRIGIYDSKKEVTIGVASEVCVHQSLESLLEISDVIVICASQMEDKQLILNSENIPLMKKKAIVINTSRGSLWDEKAIYEALIRGDISGVGVDVYEGEENADFKPSPFFQSRNSSLNLIATPHIGGASLDAQELVTREIAKRIKRLILEG